MDSHTAAPGLQHSGSETRVSLISNVNIYMHLYRLHYMCRGKHLLSFLFRETTRPRRRQCGLSPIIPVVERWSKWPTWSIAMCWSLCSTCWQPKTAKSSWSSWMQSTIFYRYIAKKTLLLSWHWCWPQQVCPRSAIKKMLLTLMCAMCQVGFLSNLISNLKKLAMKMLSSRIDNKQCLEIERGEACY